MTTWSIGWVDLMLPPQREGPNAPLNELDENGCCPLMYAAMADAVPAVEMVLNFSAKREMVSWKHCISSMVLLLMGRLIHWGGLLCTMLLSLGGTRLSSSSSSRLQTGHRGDLRFLLRYAP